MSTLAWTCAVRGRRHAYASVGMAPETWYLTPDTTRNRRRGPTIVIWRQRIAATGIIPVKNFDLSRSFGARGYTYIRKLKLISAHR